MIGPSGREQQGLGLGFPPLLSATQQQSPDLLGAFAPARLASLDDVKAARTKGGPKIQPTATDGYWLLLRPLPKGKHTLRFGGSLPSLRQELVYTLIVE